MSLVSEQVEQEENGTDLPWNRKKKAGRVPDNLKITKYQIRVVTGKGRKSEEWEG